MFATSWYQLYFLITVHLCIIDCTSHNHASHDCGLWHQSVATAAYRALETETTVW